MTMLSAQGFFAISFVAFFVFAWKFIRSAFLQTVESYRSNIVSGLKTADEAYTSAMVRIQEAKKQFNDLHLAHSSTILNAKNYADKIKTNINAEIIDAKKRILKTADDQIHAIKHFKHKDLTDTILNESFAIISVGMQKKEYSVKYLDIASKEIINTLKNESR